MSFYPDNYHLELDRRLQSNEKATEMITEVSTVRLIAQDDDTFLNWAKKPYVCIIFNLHVNHTIEGRQCSAATFRKLIDLGTRFGGGYYLTYHKFATREQVLKCYPQFPEFLRQKKRYDPKEVFQSDWYRFYKNNVRRCPVKTREAATVTTLNESQRRHFLWIGRVCDSLRPIPRKPASFEEASMTLSEPATMLTD